MLLIDDLVMLRKYHIGGNVRFRVKNALDIIEDVTGARPDPWNQEDAA